MRYPCRNTIAVLLALLASQEVASARDRIIILGSSTVYPFSAVVAEHFARSGPFPEPDVRATSTGEGLKLFCSKTGSDTPDIGTASRPMSQAERARCQGNGVREIAEIRIGYDSLILANSAAVPTFNITLAQLWRAAAGRVPVNGRLVANPYHRWREISPSLPDRPIKLIGPANGHGTREAFVELVLEPSCKQALTDSALAVEEPLAACRMVRNDGGWKDVDDLELTLGKLATDRDSMGILTFSYLEQFGKRIHAATVEGVSASRASIPTGRYPLSRPLFIYVNVGHLGTTQGLADYAAEFVSFCAAGAHGYLADEGLVPLPAQELLAQRAAVARLQR